MSLVQKDTTRPLSLLDKIDAGLSVSIVDAASNDGEVSDHEPVTPKPKKRRATTASPTTKTSPKTKGSPGKDRPAPGELSRKGKYWMLIFEAGIAALKKEEVEAETGLSTSQQNDLIRRDKGSMRKAAEGLAATF